VQGYKTFLLSTVDAKKAFDGMPDGVIQKADAQCAALASKPATGANQKPRRVHLRGSCCAEPA
jgi:hypothetical protein